MNQLTNRGPLGSPPLPTGSSPPSKCKLTAALAGALSLFLLTPGASALTIESAAWNGRQLIVDGTGDKGDTVEVTAQNGQPIGSSRVGGNLSWTVRANSPEPVPCTVTASAGGETDVSGVANAPGCGGNTAPTAVDDAYDTPQDTVLSVEAPGVLGNDTDAEGDDLTAVLNSDPSSGSVSLNANGSFDYTPNGGFTGSDSFTYLADDGRGGSAEANVTITVTPALASQCPDPAPTTAAEAHAKCTTPYTGPEVCVACHEQEAVDMHGSVHYQQNGPAINITNLNDPGTPFDQAVRAGERGFDVAVTGINTYCGSHENSPRFTCAGCHVGNGRFPMAQSEFEQLDSASQAYHDQLANIDCLTCHQEQYRRFPNWIGADGTLDLNLFEDLSLENVALDGNGDLISDPGKQVVRSGLAGIPVVDPDTLDFEFAPAGGPGSLSFELPADSPFAPMTITTEVAVQTVHATTRRSCLSCHAGAGGADGAKRGDLTSLHANPDITLDQHMSPAGPNLTCSDCHSAVGNNGETHRVRGRGLDLRPNDVSERFTCENSGCHSDTEHGDFDYNSPTRDTHAVKVACQTCHIPTYGKGVATETSRDWEDPHLSQTACNGRGGWLPREDKGANLVPSYAWFDGFSEVYYMGESLNSVPTVPLAADVANRFVGSFSAGDPAISLGVPAAILDADGNIDMSLGVNNPDAKLQPMKEHWGKLARNDRTNTLIAHSTYDFFRTGDYDLAVQSGLAQDPDMNESDSYTIVPVHTFQAINHGVEIRDSALVCGDCHQPLNANARIDLQADYGYGLRTGPSVVINSRVSGSLNGDLNRICSQCHGNETGGRGFESVHSRHVASRSRDCAACHNFTRLEERSGLNLNN